MTKMVSYTLSARPIFWRLGRCIIYSGIVITATSKWVSTNPNNRPLALGILAVAALLGLALPLKGEVTETTRRSSHSTLGENEQNWIKANEHDPFR